MEPLNRLTISSGLRRVVIGNRSCSISRCTPCYNSLTNRDKSASSSTGYENTRSLCKSAVTECSAFMLTVRSCSSETLEVCRKWTEVSFEELQDLIQAGDIQLFDVREPKELIDYGQMPNAVNIPLGQLYDALRMSSEKFEKHFRVPKPHHDDDNIMFTCLGGIRSHKALLLSHDLGFRKARHYKGGWEEWSERTNQPLKIKK